MKKEKIINITHNDLDGIGSAIVLGYYFNVEPYYCGYHDVEPLLIKILDELESGKRNDITGIVISDISFRETTGLAHRIQKFNQEYKFFKLKKSLNNFITLRDHHATSYYLNKYSWAYSKEVDIRGKKRCGTQLVLDMMVKERGRDSVNKSLKEFVKLVNLWDTWRWVDDFKKPYMLASDLNLIYSTKGQSWFFCDCLKAIKADTSVISDSEKCLVKSKKIEIEQDVKTKNHEIQVVDFQYRSCDSNQIFLKNYVNSYTERDLSYLLSPSYCSNLKCGVIFAEKNLSYIGNSLSELHPELDFIALIAFPNKLSLRSTKDLSVPLGVVANYLTGTGGGHPKSAGATIQNYISKTAIMKLFNTYSYDKQR